MKVLYALVFVLFSFAAPAQTLEALIAPYYLGDVDCFGEMNQQSAMPSPIIGMRPFCAAMLSDADGVAITAPPKGEEDIPPEAVQPGEQNSTVKLPAGSDELAVDDTIEQSATSTQPAATKPTIGTLSEVKPDVGNSATTGHTDAEDIPVGAITPNAGNLTAEYLTGLDDELMMGDTNKHSTMSARTVATKPTIEYGEAKISEADDVAITGSNYSKDVDVGAIEASDRTPTPTYSGQSDHQSTVDGTID